MTVLAISGEIDMANAAMLEEAVTAVLAEDPAAVVIDLLQVQFLGSAGLSFLVSTRERIGNSARFAIAAHGPITSRLIQLTHADEILPLYETLQDAVVAVTKPSDEQIRDE